MDPVTHTLFGAALSRTGLNRKTGLATVTLVLSAELPDIDVLMNFAGPVTAFATHRGFTHTLLGAPVIAAVSLAIVFVIWKLMVRRGRPPKLPVDWRWLSACGLLGSLSHILLDFTNTYGVRPFSPFYHRWFAWDIVNILDPFITGALALALIVPWFFGIIGGEIGEKRQPFPGRIAAITTLIFIASLWWLRDFNHRRAVTLLQQQTYLDAEPVRVSANPYAWNPFRWHGVVETENFFQTVPVDTWNRVVDPRQDAITSYKPEETPITLAAKNSRLGKVYLDWARHPIADVEILDPPLGGYIVRLRDLRYAYPELDRKVLFVAVVLDRNLNVIEQRVGERQEND